MQRKSKLAALLIAAIVGFVGLLVVLVSNSTSGPGDPGKSYAAILHKRCAIIAIKNQTSTSLTYFATVERKISGKWHEGSASFAANLGPGQQTNLTMIVMVYAPSYPWRISVFADRTPVPVQVNSMRFRAGVWCSKHDLLDISHKLLGAFEPIQISTQEMAQWEK